MLKSKSWAKKNNPVYHSKNDKRFGITVYGALGKCLRNVQVIQLGSSTNMVEFRHFLFKVKQAVSEKYATDKPYFLYDGATAHTSPVVVNAIAEFFIPVQIPSYSCEFNSIEKLWSVAKSYYVKRLLQIFQVEGCISEMRFRELVEESFSQIPRDKLVRLHGANRKYIAEMLAVARRGRQAQGGRRSASLELRAGGAQAQAGMEEDVVAHGLR